MTDAPREPDSHTLLRAHLAARQDFRGSAWLETLHPRKREEAEFHNFEREQSNQAVLAEQRAVDVHANRRFYSVTESSKAYMDRWLERNVPGKVFLDYACGNGKQAIRAARLGSVISIGIDISDVSVANARAASADVSDRCFFVQGDCEATELPDRSVDIILCSGMLHHLELKNAYPELRRILRPGGKVLAVEAFGHNPLIQWYRNRTPHLRTDWEKDHILRWGDVELAQTWFEVGEVRYWHLFSLLAVPLRRTAIFRPVLSALTQLDELVLTTNFTGRMAWQITFELRVPDE